MPIAEIIAIQHYRLSFLLRREKNIGKMFSRHQCWRNNIYNMFPNFNFTVYDVLNGNNVTGAKYEPFDTIYYIFNIIENHNITRFKPLNEKIQHGYFQRQASDKYITNNNNNYYKNKYLAHFYFVFFSTSLRRLRWIRGANCRRATPGRVLLWGKKLKRFTGFVLLVVHVNTLCFNPLNSKCLKTIGKNLFNITLLVSCGNKRWSRLL